MTPTLRDELMKMVDAADAVLATCQARDRTAAEMGGLRSERLTKDEFDRQYAKLRQRYDVDIDDVSDAHSRLDDLLDITRNPERIKALAEVAMAAEELGVVDDPTFGGAYRNIARALERLRKTVGT